MGDAYLGGAFFFSGSFNEFKKSSKAMNDCLKIPPFISSDFETGPGYLLKDETDFPFPMGVAATGNSDYAYKTAEKAAKVAEIDKVY